MGGNVGSIESGPDPLESGRLIGRLQEGDADALAGLLREYSRPLFRYAVRLIRDPDAAQDLVQETFVRLWLGRARLRPGSIRSYLYRVLHNLAVDDLRKRKTRDSTLAMVEAEVAPGSAGGDDGTTDSTVARAIDALPERRREAFILAYVHRLTYREIAEVMNVSPATVKNQVAAALAQLREALRPLRAELKEVE
jgi:RNA polymerase sigma-70 factor (ECF subfamily)